MPPDSLPIYSRILQEPPYGVAGAQVLVDTSFSPSEIAGIKGELATLDDINTRLQRLEQSEVQNVREQQRIANSLSGYRMDSLDFVNFSRQLMLAFPRVQEVSLARAQTAGKYGSGDEVPYSQDLPLVAVRENATRVSAEEEDRMRRYLKLQLKLDTLILVRQTQ